MHISRKIPSRLQAIPGFLAGIIEEIRKLNIPDPELFKVKLALGEALVNAVKHGNKLNEKLSVYFELEAGTGRIIFKVRDEGIGFTPGNLPDPTKEENLDKTGGRGVFLIRSLMDEVEYSDYGRELKMVKFLQKGVAQ